MNSNIRGAKDRTVQQRRWWFTLAKSFLLLAGMAIVFHMFGVALQRRWRLEALEDARRAVRETGAAAFADDQLIGMGCDCFARQATMIESLRMMDVARIIAPIDPQKMAQIATLPKLRGLCLDHCRVNDRSLAQIANCTSLNVLHLANAKLSDEGLQHLRRLKRLEFLDLSGVPIGDAGIQSLRHLDELQMLDLGETNISDAALPSLRRLGNLQVLCLQGTDISADGVANLPELPKLRGICLQRSQVDQNVLKRFASLSAILIVDGDEDEQFIDEVKTTNGSRDNVLFREDDLFVLKPRFELLFRENVAGRSLGGKMFQHAGRRTNLVLIHSAQRTALRALEEQAVSIGSKSLSAGK